MTIGVVETLVLIFGVVWFLYKFYQKRNLRHLCIPLLLLSLLLTRWPLFLPTRIGLAGMAFVAGGFLIYEQFFQHKGKTAASPLGYIYILLFFLFAVLFIGESMIPH